MVKERSEISQEDKWNVEALYKDPDEWEKDFAGIKKLADASWPSLLQNKGKIGEGAEVLKKTLVEQLRISRQIDKLYTYAHLRHDEDVALEKHKSAYDRITSLYYAFSNAGSWIEPEILALDEQKLLKYLDHPDLKEYKVLLEKIIRLKPHTLDAEKEALLSLAAKPLASSSKTFSLLNNADIKFPNVTNGKGESLELTHGLYSTYLQSQDRMLRKGSFFKLHETYQGYENTICELLNGDIEAAIFYAKAKNYANTLEAALFPYQIDVSVYHSLIEAVRNNLDKHHRYIELRKKILKYDELHFYDLYQPIMKNVDLRYSFDEALHHVIASLEPLGKEYQAQAERGIREERWIDRFENKRKRSGAYSSGCYDSMPYILLNYKGYLRDVMTLTHELGHSMHSFYSRKNQPFHYSHYPIFVAEVASTFHEELLFMHLLKIAKSDEEKAFLISQKIDDVRSTFFRQTMFAEFEKTIHAFAEKGVPLTPGTLKETYQNLNREFFGKHFTLDDILSVEFLRIPHFYSNFYVYQYATGISASYSLVQKVINEGAKDKYIQFLSSGGSDYPLELLKKAGVDMTKTEAFDVLLNRFGKLVESVEKIFKT